VEWKIPSFTSSKYVTFHVRFQNNPIMRTGLDFKSSHFDPDSRLRLGLEQIARTSNSDLTYYIRTVYSSENNLPYVPSFEDQNVRYSICSINSKWRQTLINTSVHKLWRSGRRVEPVRTRVQKGRSVISLTSEWHFVKTFFFKIGLETNLK
jgi:hypothetical protein